MTSPAPPAAAVALTAPPAVGFWQAFAFWLKLGCISFGGPAGQIAIMHSELVQRRRWISEQRFLHALNYCMLLPGPEAQQLATYIGWLLHRSWGGIAAGVLFVLPSLLLLIVLSWVYVAFGQLPWVAGVFDGIKPAVAAIVLQAAWRIGQRTLKNPWLCAIAAAAFVALFVVHLPFPLIVLGAALAGVIGGRLSPASFQPGGGHGPAQAAWGPALIDDHTPPPAHAVFHWGRLVGIVGVAAVLWCLPMAVLMALAGGWQGPLAQMGWFFTKAALLTFGGAYAVLPYVHQGAVLQHGWLSAPQMMDGLALGETTPGPLIMVVAFVGFVGGWQSQALQASLGLTGSGAQFMVAALAATVVTWFTFLPSFVFILAGGPLVEATHGALRTTAPLTAITAAVVGVILNLGLFFAQHVLWPLGLGGWRDAGLLGGLDLPAAVIMVAAAVALLRYQRPVIHVIVACALAGLALRLLR